VRASLRFCRLSNSASDNCCAIYTAATNTLRQLCESGPGGRQSAEMYFEALSDAGFASAVHYGALRAIAMMHAGAQLNDVAHSGVIMDACQNMSEVNMWTKHMGEHKVAFDDHTYTILHKVMTRLGNFEGAVATLRAALQEGQTTQEAAGASITTTLNELVRRGDSHSWDYFRALRRAQLASHYQFNIMLGMCSSLPAVQNLVAEMEADSVTWDAITYISLHAALVRCGEHHEAVTVLQRGCERGLVDANAQGIAATGALKHIMKDDQALSIAERAVMAQNYVALLRQAVGRVDAFQYCFLLRHCCLDTAALDNIVVELDQAGLEHDFHLCASLHRAYSRFGMSDAAATALRQLRENFADLHVARKASVDEVKYPSAAQRVSVVAKNVCTHAAVQHYDTYLRQTRVCAEDPGADGRSRGRIRPVHLHDLLQRIRTLWSV
jgi:hypothetical protein